MVSIKAHVLLSTVFQQKMVNVWNATFKDENQSHNSATSNIHLQFSFSRNIFRLQSFMAIVPLDNKDWYATLPRWDHVHLIFDKIWSIERYYD